MREIHVKMLISEGKLARSLKTVKRQILGVLDTGDSQLPSVPDAGESFKNLNNFGRNTNEPILGKNNSHI